MSTPTTSAARVPPPTWRKQLLRAGGFGAGFAVTISVLLAMAVWWSARPKSERPLDATAITAKFTDLAVQRKSDGKVHIWFRYALTNNTERDYVLPADGAFMKVVPEGGFQKLADATWDSNLRFPPRQTVNTEFHLLIDPTEYNTTIDELDKDNEKNLFPFVGRRLKDMNGLAFFDYQNRYEIDMPNGWKEMKPDAK